MTHRKPIAERVGDAAIQAAHEMERFGESGQAIFWCGDPELMHLIHNRVWGQTDHHPMVKMRRVLKVLERDARFVKCYIRAHTLTGRERQRQIKHRAFAYAKSREA